MHTISIQSISVITDMALPCDSILRKFDYKNCSTQRNANNEQN